MFGRNKKPNFFDLEEARIQQRMMTLETNSPEYKEAQQELKTMISLRGESKESKRRISKGDKGQMLIKGLGIGGILVAIFGMAKFEKDGNTFTGEKRRWVDTLVSNLGRFNLFG